MATTDWRRVPAGQPLCPTLTTVAAPETTSQHGSDEAKRARRAEVTAGFGAALHFDSHDGEGVDQGGGGSFRHPKARPPHTASAAAFRTPATPRDRRPLTAQMASPACPRGPRSSEIPGAHRFELRTLDHRRWRSLRLRRLAPARHGARVVASSTSAAWSSVRRRAGASPLAAR